MDEKSLYTKILGIKLSCYVKQVVVDEAAERIDIYMDHEPDIRVRCARRPILWHYLRPEHYVERLIGLIPEQNIFNQIERYEPLARYLEARTGYKINLVVLPRYGNVIDNFVSKGMDGAFFGSFTYTLAHAKLGVEVVARPETLEGISTYYGLIFVRKDSGIKTAAAMRGKRFAFVDKATTAGYLLPLHYFHKNGIKNYHTFFRETYFAGTRRLSGHRITGQALQNFLI